MRKAMSFVSFLIAVCLMSSCGGSNNQSQALMPDSSIDGQIEVIEKNGSTNSTENNSNTTFSRISITAGETVIYGTMFDNQTARDFVGLLPLTLNAFDRIDLVKSTMLTQSISDNGERTRNYSLGSIFYWPEGPEVAFCYSDHLPETVVDIIHIGMIESGVELFEDYTGEILIELADEAPTQIEINEQNINIKMAIGEVVATAELNDSDIARQFATLLPQTITMSRGRDREYYGRIDGTLTYDDEDIQTIAEDGDLAYWFSGNSLAFFFNTENDSAVNSGIVVFGKITSDLSIFDNMGSSETVTVTLLE